MDITGVDDPTDLTDGEWVKKIPNLPGVELRVRSAFYRPYVRARDRAIREAAPDMATAEGEDVFWAITGQAMAKHLLLDWKGLTMGGKDVPFDGALAAKLLKAEDPHGIGEKFLKGVDWASTKVAAGLAAKTERLAKNLPPPSDGQSSTARRSRR